MLGCRNWRAVARAPRAYLGGYCLRFRAPPRANIWCGRLCGASRAASTGDDMMRGTHRPTVLNGPRDAGTISYCLGSAFRRVCTHIPASFCALRHLPPPLSSPCGDLCLSHLLRRCQCCVAIVRRSFGERAFDCCAGLRVHAERSGQDRLGPVTRYARRHAGPKRQVDRRELASELASCSAGSGRCGRSFCVPCLTEQALGVRGSKRCVRAVCAR